MTYQLIIVCKKKEDFLMIGLSRARALQDFVYALVKSEMDTDFEDECREIVERRTKVNFLDLVEIKNDGLIVNVSLLKLFFYQDL